VRVAGGREVSASRAVLADVAATSLYLELLPREEVPARLLQDIRRFQFDNGTVKLDWALDAPFPGRPRRRARPAPSTWPRGMDALTDAGTDLFRRRIPASPFLVAGQYSVADPTRAPEGKEAAWAYTHVPRDVRSDAGPDGLTGSWDERETEAFSSRMEDQIERLAPGFRDLIRSRHVFTPGDLQREDANLVGGALNAGTAQLHQQVVFRPTPGLARAETPVRGPLSGLGLGASRRRGAWRTRQQRRPGRALGPAAQAGDGRPGRSGRGVGRRPTCQIEVAGLTPGACNT
jgi:phytoene dehydrogenase-like protein